MRITVLIFLIFYSILIHADPIIKGTPRELNSFLNGALRTVSIKAESRLKVRYTRSLLKFAVVTEDQNMVKALKDNINIRKKIRTLFQKSGIEPQNITESRFSSTPQSNLFGKKSDLFNIVNTLSVTVNSEEQMIDVIYLVEVNNNIFFISSKVQVGDKEEIENKLIKQTLTQIKRKSKIYENDLNVILQPVAFEESELKIEELSRVDSYRNSKFGSSSQGNLNINLRNYGKIVYTISITATYRLISK